MKATIITIFIVILLLTSVVHAETALNFSQQSSQAVNLRGGDIGQFSVNEVRQDPLPANPGEYTDLYINLDNLGGEVKNPQFQLTLPYPLSMDPSSDQNDRPTTLNSGDRLSLRYKLRVDKQALPGDYEVQFHAFSGSQTSYPYYFKVKVDDVTSSFDAALQEVTKDGGSLALSNIGKNTANAITVRLDEQTDFDLLGSTSYIIGNLNAGDYTLLNILVSPKDASKKQLKLHVVIEYTDTVGNRRTVVKDLPILMTSKIKQGFQDLDQNILTASIQKETSNPTTLIIVIAVIIIGVIGFFMYRRKRKRKDDE